MSGISIYLTFNGNCEAAFEFYRRIFGGEFSYMSKFKDMPRQEGLPPVPAEMGEHIMHVSLPVGDHTVLMGSDTGGEWAPALIEGNNFSLSYNADTREDADRIFSSLSAGGKVTMPMAEAFWGEYFGMCADPYGINWMVSLRSA